MPLDNNAKIGEIITALGGMQGINQKAELASVIGAPAIASDNVATQITKIQNAKDVLASKVGVPNTTPLQAMADALIVGKKWASGIGVGSGYMLTVNNLPFKPRVISVHKVGTTLNQNYTYYNRDQSSSKYLFVSNQMAVERDLTYNGGYINDTGFRLNSEDGNISWEASE
ncbi:MAG: hypothetical protein RR595_08630 [Lysinibacillus sp.]